MQIKERIDKISDRYDLKRKWYRFSKSPLSLVGLAIAVISVFLALAAPYVVPYPTHAGLVTNFKDKFLPPSLNYLFGTDEIGRDVLSRTIFGFQYSMMMAAVVLGLVIPPGVVLGLVAGYYRGTWIDSLIMRIADVFIAVPALVLALAIAAVLEPSVFNAMMAVSLMWWPWYTRLVYNTTSALRNEYFVQAAEVMGASPFHMIFREILPNCLGPILTKITLDVGWVILLGSALSFVGLGAQPPTPDLGTMVASGGNYMPDAWWISMFPATAICIIILGFNLLGDGIRDIFVEEAR
ncbi:MAG: ABC transporter permease [Candidatus Bathycorpusculaceae bacterium]